MLWFTLSFPILLLLLLCCTGCISSRKRHKWKRVGDEAAGATAARMANFGWAMFTLGSPLAVSGLLALTKKLKGDNVGGPARSISGPGALVACIPFVLVIPLLALVQLYKAKTAGILHSRAFQARYGWLCNRYDASLLPE